MPARLKHHYEKLKKAAYADLGSTAVQELLISVVFHARTLLQDARLITLPSTNQKRYIAFQLANHSRPVNAELFCLDLTEFELQLDLFRQGFAGAESQDITRAVYTFANLVFVANDIHGIGRKASATYFEVLIGHLVARLIGVNPRKRVRMPESQAELSTDYVFDLGAGLGKVHLPLKTSTRERAVQAWVHQLILDRIFGDGVYTGILVVGGETKRNLKTGEVIEVCVPKQLQIFQSRVAKIQRIYYLDPPNVYLALASGFPKIAVKHFGDMFTELPDLLSK